MPQTISSLEGFVRKIGKVSPSTDEVLLYRGHSNRKLFKLNPSILRSISSVQSEHILIRELVASHPGDFSDDLTTLEQLVRVQHFSLPTRLLDVTWNPLVGLYFAIKEFPGISGEVIVFRVKKETYKIL